jgi:hypothetical protein
VESSEKNRLLKRKRGDKSIFQETYRRGGFTS